MTKSRLCPLGYLSLVFLGFCLFVTPIHAQTTKRAEPCFRLSKQRKYLRAAHCFRKVARQLGQVKNNSYTRSVQANLVRNSALAFFYASRQTKQASVRGYRLERAIRMYRRFLKDKLCRSRHHCRRIKRRIRKLSKRITYKQLEVTATKGRRTKVIIRGYRFYVVHIAPPPWRGKVREGKYTITYKYKNLPARRTQLIVTKRTKKIVRLVLRPPRIRRIARRKRIRKPRKRIPKPRKRRVAKARPRPRPRIATKIKKQPKPQPRPRIVAKVRKRPKPRPKPKKRRIAKAKKRPKPRPPTKKKKKPQVALIQRRTPPPVVNKPNRTGPILLMAGGGLALAGGAVALGLGYGESNAVQQDVATLQEQGEDRTQEDNILDAKSGSSAGELTKRYNTASTQVTTGWIVAGAGIALGATGVIWYLVQNANARPTTPLPPPSTRVKQLFSSTTGRSNKQ